MLKYHISKNIDFSYAHSKNETRTVNPTLSSSLLLLSQSLQGPGQMRSGLESLGLDQQGTYHWLYYHYHYNYHYDHYHSTVRTTIPRLLLHNLYSPPFFGTERDVLVGWLAGWLAGWLTGGWASFLHHSSLYLEWMEP